MAKARLIRNTNIVAGMGGHLAVNNIPAEGQQNNADSGILYDVAVWTLFLEYLTTRTTHSGSNGAILRKRTGQDTRFKVEVPYDVDSFIDAVFQPSIAWDPKDKSISITFTMGDPSQYPLGVANQYHLRGCILEKVTVICDSTGESVLRAVIEGSGTQLVEGYANSALADF